jgi:hypothetical protein
MNAIKSIYIPNIERAISAQYIAKVFDKAGLAKVSKIAIEPNRNSCRVYAEIDYWHDSEAAYNFITRLKTPRFEARFVHDDDNWWVVQANKFPHKTENTGRKGRIITIFVQEDPIKTLDFEMPDTELVECDYLHEKYEWVDKKLEAMAEQERIDYEASAYDEDFQQENFEEEYDNYTIEEMKRYYEECDMEDREYEREQDFIEEAEEYYDKMMKNKEKMKKKLSPSDYKIWEMNKQFATTTRQFQYEEYLKTGAIFA